ncbi:MAG: tRNA (guanosine(46)-N7)-methyltransferase TrmB [Pseudomonadota bacterium]
MHSDSPEIYRPVRSFVRRAGRVTIAQREALDTLLPSYALDLTGPFDAEGVFGRVAPCWLEIGFGNGGVLLDLAARFPDVDFVGAEVHDPGVGRLLIGLHEQRLTNVRVHHGDVTDLFSGCIPNDTLARILLFFPDPWPKKRHHKRRFVQPVRARQLAQLLCEGGVLHAATDWQPYAEDMLAVFEAEPLLTNTSASGNFAPDADVRPETHFERRGRRLGHDVWDLIFRRGP